MTNNFAAVHGANTDKTHAMNTLISMHFPTCTITTLFYMNICILCINVYMYMYITLISYIHV